jgi:hypothetical protein
MSETPVYDRCVEKLLDAADEMFSLRSIGRTAVCLVLLTSPAHPEDRCAVINDEDILTYWGFPAADVRRTFDSRKREVCYRFLPVVPNMTVEPDRLCIDIDALEDAKTPLLMKFPSGAALDVRREYSLDRSRWQFDNHLKTCRGLINARIA